ncbi:MAG: CPBP family intramembrane metalloprotease [Oscillospiraceae bacterium]|nr:CPBP family intramembrane metalloprotease [Oscillospiraceae bacterium]
MDGNIKVTWKTTLLGSFLAIISLIVSQLLSQGIGELFAMVKIPQYIAAVISAILYPLFTFLSLKISIEKLLNIPLNTLRFKRFQLNIAGIIIAILLPALVVISYLFMQGEWAESDISPADKITVAVTGICYYSIAAGIVEEMVFRGVIMGLLEKWKNTKIAMLVPSVLFGLIHILNGALSPMSLIQLAAAGTVVGILFSLIAYHYDNFWNNALVHALWNASTIGIMHIGTEPYEHSVYTYVLKSESMMITGGDFGIEASVISIIAYLLFIGIMIFLMKRSKTN